MVMTTPYRDDFDAAQEKLAELEQELRAVKTRADELSKLKRDEASLAREVAALTSRLEGMAKKRALPLLDNVRIASPCKADWDEMIGDARVRFCASCQKDVYNLSEMARQDAESFLREKAGNACVRLYRRADGTVLTADCPVGQRKRRRLRNVAMVALSGSFLAAGALFSWRSPLTRSTDDNAQLSLDSQVGALQPSPEMEAPPPKHPLVTMGGLGVSPPSPAPKPPVVNSKGTPHPAIRRSSQGSMGNL
jgi:hypothetical protein